MESEAALQVQSVKKYSSLLFAKYQRHSHSSLTLFYLTTAKKKVSMATDVAFFDILVED